MKLTQQQKNTLFVVSQRQPVSVAEVARSLLKSEKNEASRLNALELKGLVERQHTGLRPGRARVGYALTAAGREALEALELEEDYDPVEGQ